VGQVSGLACLIFLCTLESLPPNKVKAAMSSSSHTQFVGAIDQGTTSTRFLIFNRAGEVVALHQLEFKQIYPNPG
jgi:glycerol kinase